jgi:hypothetical protein
MKRINEIIAEIHYLESELNDKLKIHKDHLMHDFEEKKKHFEYELIEQQKRFKTGLIKYLWTADIRSYLAAPFIYSLIIPFVFLDICVTVYQAICFPLFGIQRIKRADFITFDRAHLAYLNLFEKINCAYCSYANGLVAYVREIGGKTEQFWCPIKHAKKAYLGHPYYKNFLEYGDALSYQAKLDELRKKLRK